MKNQNLKIFINYRREDEQNIVFAIANSLMREYGVENIFYDRQAIPPATNFHEKIDTALDQCAILVVIIGNRWLDILNQKRTLSQKDYVIAEIEHAINKGKYVLPILLDKTTMPQPISLPESIKALSHLNAVKFSTNDMHSSSKLLVAEINDLFKRGLPAKANRSISNKWLLGATVALIIVFLAIIIFRRTPAFKNDKDQVETVAILPMSDEAFRAKILTTAALIKNDPVQNSSKSIAQLRELIEIEQKNPYYSKNLKTETSILNRIYGAAKIIDSQDPNIKSSIYFKEAFPYIKRSFSIEPEIWKTDHDKEAFNFMAEINRNIEETDFTEIEFIKKYLRQVFTIAMYSASTEEIDIKYNPIVGVFSSTTEVLQFFADYPVGNTNHKLMIEAIKIMLQGMGSNLQGPEILNKGNNIYNINYWLEDSKGIRKNLTWKVDMNAKKVSPYTEDAKRFTEAIAAKK